MSISIDVTKFCAVGDMRAYLASPFNIKGVGQVACNGWAGIVQENDAETSEGLPPTFPTMFREWKAKLPASGSGIPMASLALPDKMPCDKCRGTGMQRGVKECRECDGDGDFYHGSHTYECKECEGTGEVEDPLQPKTTCTKCNGTGEAFQLAKVGHSTFNTTWLRLFSELPDAAIHIGDNPMASAFITFDGGWGVLMPCRE